MRPVAIVVATFIAMEPLTALTHRFVMHGIGRALHRSHHTATRSTHGFEANDAFPMMFAAAVMVAMALGFNVGGFAALVPIGLGITTYGVAYALVHDVYIHRRLPIRARSIPLLDRLAAAHRVHHQHNGAPYGMLLPLVGHRNGSRPSHVPDQL